MVQMPHANLADVNECSVHPRDTPHYDAMLTKQLAKSDLVS